MKTLARWFNSQPIARQISAIAATLSFAAFLGFSAAVYAFAKHAAEQAAIADATHQMALVSGNIERAYDAAERRAVESLAFFLSGFPEPFSIDARGATPTSRGPAPSLLSGSTPLTGNPLPLRDFASRTRAGEPAFLVNDRGRAIRASTLLTDASGHPMDGAGYPAGDPTEAAFFSGKPATLLIRRGGRLYAQAIEPILKAPNGTVLAAATMRVDLARDIETLSAGLSETRLGSTGEIFALEAAAVPKLAAGSKGRDQLWVDSIPGLASAMPDILEQTRGDRPYHAHLLQDGIALFADPIQKWNWILVGVAKHEEMFEGARAISSALLASGLAAAALLAATLSLALTSAFSRLAPALAALRLIGQGTFTHKLDIPEGPSLNEISLLGREINDASDSLERLEDSLLQTQSQLAQSEKLASIGQLAAGVAHEINNPIGFISSNANTLTEYCDDLLEVARKAKALCQSEPLPSNPLAAELALSLDSAGLDWLEADIPTLLSETKDGIERVRVIVQSLKDFSRPDANDGQWIMSDLCAGLRSSCVIARNEVKYIADIVDELPPTLEAECHPQALNQVFLNIIVNAAHAISALGSERGTIRLRAGSDGAFAWIDISDNGTGMDDQTIQRVFDPFFTTKPVGKGTGLGLSIAHGIVAGKHRGSIAIQSAPGQGSTFTLRIPLRQVSPLPNHPNPP